MWPGASTLAQDGMRMSEETANCTICRQPLGENGRCQHCDEDSHIWTIQDWRPLLTLSLVIVLGFSFTRLVVQRLRRKAAGAGRRNTMPREAARAMDAKQTSAGRRWTHFEAALVYSHDNFQYPAETDRRAAGLGRDQRGAGAVARASGISARRCAGESEAGAAGGAAPSRGRGPALLPGGHRRRVAGAHRSVSAANRRCALSRRNTCVRQGRHEQAEGALRRWRRFCRNSPPEQERLASLYSAQRRRGAGAEHCIRQQLSAERQTDATRISGRSAGEPCHRQLCGGAALSGGGEAGDRGIAGAAAAARSHGSAGPVCADR